MYRTRLRFFSLIIILLFIQTLTAQNTRVLGYVKDENNKLNVYLKDFLQTLLNSISTSTGLINDLVLTHSPYNESELIIMDVNLLNKTFMNSVL